MRSSFSIKVIGLMLLFLVVCSQTIEAEEKGDPLRGWKMIPVGGAIVTFEADNTVFRSGNSSLKVTHHSPSAPDIYGYISQRVEVQPDTAYLFRAYVKAKNLSKVFFTIREDKGGDRRQYLPDRQYLPSGTYDWQPIEFDFVTEENQTYIVMRLLTDGITEALWIDDIELVEYGTTKNLIFNGGFEREK